VIRFRTNDEVMFEVDRPDAARVHLVGAFAGWHEQLIPMTRSTAGVWRAELRLGAGEYLFRYLVDGVEWVIDPDAHGIRPDSEGVLWSRLWRPPASMDPDAIAA